MYPYCGPQGALAFTGLPGSRNVTSAMPQGVSAWPSSTGSQPSSADASYMSNLPSSARAPRNTAGGDSLFRATASQCLTRGWLGTYTYGYIIVCEKLL